MAQGGYRKPANPAPQSGPGALSQRTDGGPASKQAVRYIAGMPYGEGADFTDIQSMAPMEKSQGVKPMPAGQVRDAVASQAPQQPIVPLNAPSAMPNVPVTDGADAGAGRGMAALGLPDQTQAQYQSAYSLLQAAAAGPDATPALKYLAMRIGQGF